jgi:hypothetical protein
MDIGMGEWKLSFIEKRYRGWFDVMSEILLVLGGDVRGRRCRYWESRDHALTFTRVII